MPPHSNSEGPAPVGTNNTDPRCLCCGSASDVIEVFTRERILRELSALLGNKAIEDCALTDYQLRRCHLCELEFSEPMVEPPPEFYPWLTNSNVHYPSERWEWGECKRRLQVSSVTQTIDSPAIVVDVGCGDGRFLKELEDLNRVRAIGLDINRDVVDVCRDQGLEAICGTFASVSNQLPDGVHAVTLWHVIEHVADPVRVLLETGALLSEKGSIFFSVPLSPLSYEKSWSDPLNAPPHHLTRWGIPSLHALAARLDMHMSLVLPDADSLWYRVQRSLTLQAVSPFSGLSRGRKLVRLLKYLARHPWQLFVETGRQLRQPRINGRVGPDVVMVCLRYD